MDTVLLIWDYIQDRIVGKEIPGSKNYLKDRTEINTQSTNGVMDLSQNKEIINKINRIEKFIIDSFAVQSKHNKAISEALLASLKDSDLIIGKIDILQLTQNTR